MEPNKKLSKIERFLKTLKYIKISSKYRRNYSIPLKLKYEYFELTKKSNPRETLVCKKK